MIILTIDDIKKIVKEIGIKNVFLDLTKEIKKDFQLWEKFHKSPRHAIHYPYGVIELMPIADERYHAYKYVNGHPQNFKMNKPTVMATGQLSDTATGEPLLFTEMTLLTAFRTAATSALAGDYLMNKESTTMAIIGTGSQSEFQSLAFHFNNGIKIIRYYDLDTAIMKKFAFNLQGFDIELIPCQNVDDALRGAHVITTLTAAKSKNKVVHWEQITPGIFFNGVGGDCPGKTEVDKKILENSKVVVEYLPQSLIEGEIQNTGKEVVYAELWEIIQGLKPGRTSEQEVTFFDSVGFAIEDYSTLRLFYEYSKKLKIGRELSITPELQDPRNIFSKFI